MPLQCVERDDGERFLVRGREHDRRRDAGFKSLPPRRGTYAPAIAGFQPGETVFRYRGDEVVALFARELEERPSDLRANHVQAVVLGARVAAPVAMEAGKGRRRARRDAASEYILVIGGDRGLRLKLQWLESTTEKASRGREDFWTLPRCL